MEALVSILGTPGAIQSMPRSQKCRYTSRISMDKSVKALLKYSTSELYDKVSCSSELLEHCSKICLQERGISTFRVSVMLRVRSLWKITCFKWCELWIVRDICDVCRPVCFIRKLKCLFVRMLKWVLFLNKVVQKRRLPPREPAPNYPDKFFF